jgi:pimeloyl-ACP methyl ester carboxylesterase
MRFVLVHGGFHGAWCWSRTIPELERLGHEAIAIDLPAHGARRDERSTIADRRGAIVDVLQQGDVLVGHSGGGFDITYAADAAPGLLSHMVYLAAGLPLEGRTTLEATGGARPEDEKSHGSEVKRLMTDETGMSSFIRPNGIGRIECVDYEATAAFFYHDVDDETARWAYAQLTPAPTEFLLETVHLPNFWKADIPRSYVLCLEDRAKPHSQSVETYHRLGVAPIAIGGSHSPFLSRPAELAEKLVYATSTVPEGPLLPH